MQINPEYSTRTGKIARLPQAIRQRLNERLADGEPQQLLVAWLNEMDTIQERLEELFEGRPITEQNLSDWKQGGFLDWQRSQEARGLVLECLSEVEELGNEIGEEALLDRVTTMVAVVLLRLFREAATAESGPQQRQAVLELAREMARLRRGDHQRQHLRLLTERERRETPSEYERDRLLQIELQRQSEQEEETWSMRADALRAEYVVGRKNGALTPERQEWIEGFFEANPDLGDLPKEVDPLEEAKGKVEEEGRPQPAKRKARGKAHPEPPESTDQHPADPV
ncbi:MAG: hypothetical protein ABJF10_16485 [Chthoniobacter sp.]|uniref:hypothetical protein n=1 Tax=Chthoniobacter sp. TaxID=2510640 RepID=UPI0032A8CE1C